MGVAIAVVAHHTDDILPRAGILVGGVVERLVHEPLCLLRRPCRIAPYGHVGLAQIGGGGTCLLLDSLTIVEQTEKVVADVAVHVTEGVLALIAQQEIVRVVACPVGTVHAVIPGPVTKEQQITGDVGLCQGTVVEHFQIAAIGSGIRRTTGEFVVQFVGRHDPYAQAVVLLVPGLHPFCLCQYLLTGRDDDNHIHGLIGMMVLIHDAIDEFRHRQDGRLEAGHLLGGIQFQR